MPASSAVRPTAKTRLPGQSILPGLRVPTSCSDLYDQIVPMMPNGDADEEHRAPVDDGEQAADDEADEAAGDRGDLVDAEGEAAPVGREGIRQNRGGVGEQHRAADALHEPPDDEPHGAGRRR